MKRLVFITLILLFSPSLLASWDRKIFNLHQLRERQPIQAKKLARSLLDDPALLVRSVAVDVLLENPDDEDIELLKKQLNNPNNYHRGKELFIIHQIQYGLKKVESSNIRGRKNF